LLRGLAHLSVGWHHRVLRVRVVDREPPVPTLAMAARSVRRNSSMLLLLTLPLLLLLLPMLSTFLWNISVIPQFNQRKR
jgi:hypothetical protein